MESEEQRAREALADMVILELDEVARLQAELDAAGRNVYRLQQSMVAAISEAVERERERCACMADQVAKIGKASPFWDDNQVQMFTDLAAEIRKGPFQWELYR